MLEHDRWQNSMSRRMVLVDENEIVRAALQRHLEDSCHRHVETLRSIDDLDAYGYDIVYLNLSYYDDCSKLADSLEKVRIRHFNRLIVFSNLCFYNGWPDGDDERVTILCKKGLPNLDSGTPEASSIEMRCNQECEGFDAVGLHILRRGDRVLDSLSARETEVLRLVGRGLSSKKIASRLFISRRTVDHHRESIARKLNSKGMSELIALAILFINGLIE